MALKNTERIGIIQKLYLDNKMLSEILDLAREKNMEEAVSYTMLRSMAKAKYSDKNDGHFGLGIEKYCHFTSPIRRLSDLATHRIIKKVLFEGKNPKSYASYARRAAAAATEGELRAISAERRIEDLYKVIYMSERVGETFDIGPEFALSDFKYNRHTEEVCTKASGCEGCREVFLK